MFKFAVQTKRGQLIGLGFSEGNFEQLKLDRPIKIDFSDLGIKQPGGLIIAYPTPELAAMEKRLPDIWSLIEVNDDAMTYLRTGKPWDASLRADFHVMMFWGKDEDTLREQMGILIGPDTEDRSPSVPAGQHRHKAKP